MSLMRTLVLFCFILSAPARAELNASSLHSLMHLRADLQKGISTIEREDSREKKLKALHKLQLEIQRLENLAYNGSFYAIDVKAETIHWAEDLGKIRFRSIHEITPKNCSDTYHNFMAGYLTTTLWAQFPPSAKAALKILGDLCENPRYSTPWLYFPKSSEIEPPLDESPFLNGEKPSLATPAY